MPPGSPNRRLDLVPAVSIGPGELQFVELAKKELWVQAQDCDAYRGNRLTFI